MKCQWSCIFSTHGDLDLHTLASIHIAAQSSELLIFSSSMTPKSLSQGRITFQKQGSGILLRLKTVLILTPKDCRLIQLIMASIINHSRARIIICIHGLFSENQKEKPRDYNFHVGRIIDHDECVRERFESWQWSTEHLRSIAPIKTGVLWQSACNRIRRSCSTWLKLRQTVMNDEKDEEWSLRTRLVSGQCTSRGGRGGQLNRCAKGPCRTSTSLWPSLPAITQFNLDYIIYGSWIKTTVFQASRHGSTAESCREND